MAQPTDYIQNYKQSIQVRKGVTYLGSEIPDSDFMQMKSHGVKVSVNGGVFFDILYDDINHKDDDNTYMYNKDCVVVLGDIVKVGA